MIENEESNFRVQVYEIVARIPSGKVMTYGDVAGFAVMLTRRELSVG